MARERSVYRCQECGLGAAKPGTCPDCARLGNYVQLVEERVAPSRTGGRPAVAAAGPGLAAEAAAAPMPSGPTAAPPPTGETPRRSFALLDCDDAVVAEREFELKVGLAPEPTERVAFGVIVRPERITGGYTMTIHVLADGFTIRADERWRRDVHVTAEAPYPQFVLHLTAEPQQSDVVDRTIQAYFSIDGEPVGFAARPIRVARRAELAAAPPPAPSEAVTLMSAPTGRPVADLTVHIANGKSEADGRFRWIMVTPHDVKLPDEPLEIDLGDKPDTFAKKIALSGAAKDGRPDLYIHMVGLGRRVADQIPEQFWDVLSALYERIGKRPPTILLSTEEPYVPWELAVLDPPLDANAPPFLGAQAVVGRWVPGRASATRPARPPLVPPPEVRVSAMAVVCGRYQRAPLLEAEREAREIAAAYSAVTVNADSVDVLRCVGHGDPRAELLHFALHGRYEPDGDHDGLILIDDEILDPNDVMGSTLQWSPFVFLNACQVGSGEKVLGDYAGLAHAFLRAGASGVVAPLWSVQDAVARELAIRFYDQAFHGSSPADVLRLERARFKDAPDTVTATFLAYQYFGHPAMKISR